MEKFTRLTAAATPFLRDNVDTDLIFPGRHLKTVQRHGLGRFAFETLRFDEDGTLWEESVFDARPHGKPEILVTGANFGCGSSREHAVWAIRDLGYRCIIAAGFADIFASNCAKNGLLTVRLPRDSVVALAEAANEGPLSVDLEAERVGAPDGRTYAFEIDPFRKRCLLLGLDQVALTLEDAEAIAAFEAGQRLGQPWLYGDS